MVDQETAFVCSGDSIATIIFKPCYFCIRETKSRERIIFQFKTENWEELKEIKLFCLIVNKNFCACAFGHNKTATWKALKTFVPWIDFP